MSITLSEIDYKKMDYFINGFSIKDTILDVLLNNNQLKRIQDADLEFLAEEIKNAFSTKLNLYQGTIK